MTSFIPQVDGYNIAEKLGSGAYGQVYKAFKTEGNKEVVAIKSVNVTKLSKKEKDNLISEIEILKSLSHENIVKLYDFSWTKSHIFIIMEYCNGGSLHNLIKFKKRLSEHTCQRFLQQLVCALMYLRDKNISHFDLKPANIFISSRKRQILKVGDFGLAQCISEDDKINFIRGSPLYMAPEIVLKREYDARADIWSVGIILYECLFGKAPYSSKSFDELILKIKTEAPISIPYGSYVSRECREFLHGCLDRDLSKRFNFNTFFNHPFVDLEHRPSKDSTKKASELLFKAIEEEQNSDLNSSFSSYSKALKYLIPLLRSEKDVEKSMSLKKSINSYVTRMESIKAKLKNDSENNTENVEKIEIPTIPNLHSFSDCSRAETLTELIQLSKSTPSMLSYIDIAQSAELYENENNYSLALEKYELALQNLLPLLRKEPKGHRKELLHQMINYWLERAENLKILNLSDGMNDLATTDNDKTCSIQ